VRGRPLVAVLGATALALPACGDEDREGSFTSEGGTGTETTGTGTTATEATTTPEGEPSKTFSIGETEFKLRPGSFALTQPGVVEFAVRNDGKIVHALEVEGPTGEFETDEIAPGKRATLKADVDEAGTYELYCPVADHKERGMVGKLVVDGG
jgi:uncharacterized cupredoxin-like copper-binding protein